LARGGSAKAWLKNEKKELKANKMRISREGWILLAILGLSLFLRIYDLSGESLWLDESISLRLAHKGFSAIIKNRAANVHPPFYFLLLRNWVALFGDSEFAMRSLSVLFGLAAVFMIYKVGSLFFDREVGLWSALLLATSKFHVQYSQEARAYGLMALLTLLSFYFFRRLGREPNRWISAGYVLSTALLAYTHVFGLLIPIVQNLYFFTPFVLSPKDSGPSVKRWLLLQLYLALLFTPWIPIMFNQVFRFQGGFRRAVPSLDVVFGTFGRFAGSEGLVPLFILFALLSIMSWRNLSESAGGLRGRILFSDGRDLYLLLLWLFVPILLPFLVSQFSAPIYKYRCVIGASLAWYLLTAKGIRNLVVSPHWCNFP
jgi:uncharacterized membrane protein